MNDSGVDVSVPKELSHREAPFPQHGAEQLGQVQPDVGNVDGHVVRLLQRVCKPDKTQGHGRCKNQNSSKTKESISFLST